MKKLALLTVVLTSQLHAQTALELHIEECKQKFPSYQLSNNPPLKAQQEQLEQQCVQAAIREDQPETQLPPVWKDGNIINRAEPSIMLTAPNKNKFVKTGLLQHLYSRTQASQTTNQLAFFLAEIMLRLTIKSIYATMCKM